MGTIFFYNAFFIVWLRKNHLTVTVFNNYTYVVLRRQIARCKKQFAVTDFYEVKQLKLFCKNQSNPKSTRLTT